MAEILRRMEDVTRANQQLGRDFRDLANKLEQRYTTREVLDYRLKPLADDVAELQKAREADTSWRRSASLYLSIAAVGWILTIGTLIFTAVSSR